MIARLLIHEGGYTVGRFILNTVWFLTLGAPLALVFMLLGVFFCCTILGIPLGIVLFKEDNGSGIPV